MGDETVGKLVLSVEHPKHFALFNHQHGGGCNRGRRPHVNRLACKACFPKKISRSQDGHNGLFADLVDYTQLHTTFLNVDDALCGIALREDGFSCCKPAYCPSKTRRVEKQFHVKRSTS